MSRKLQVTLSSSAPQVVEVEDAEALAAADAAADMAELADPADDDEDAGEREVTVGEMGALFRPDLAKLPLVAPPTAPAPKGKIQETQEQAEQRAREVQLRERLNEKKGKSPAKPKADLAPKAPKAEKPKPPCECGCGQLTGGGRFIPGHDAKLKSALIKAARAVNGETLEQSAVAWERIEKLGWAHLFDEEEVTITAELNRLKRSRKTA